MTEYDDRYATCARTCATLRVYCGVDSPESITEKLGIEPSSIQPAEQRQEGRTDRPAAWFLTSEHQVDSRDVRRHVDWLLSRLRGTSAAFEALRQRGVRADVFCYWLSASGHGGPILSPKQMSALSELELEIGFDVYFLE